MQTLDMTLALKNQGFCHQQQCHSEKPGLPSNRLYGAAKHSNQKLVAAKAVATPSAAELQQVLQTEAQVLQKGLDASILDIRQGAETFDSQSALQQVQSGIEITVSNATAPFDVFSGNWSLNLLLFGTAGLLAYSIATGPKQ